VEVLRRTKIEAEYGRVWVELAFSAFDYVKSENEKEAGQVKASEEEVELACYGERKKDEWMP
jgi:hypothetical protein